MRFLTSNFSRAAFRPGAISIARFHPKFFKGREYLKLAPSYELLMMFKGGELDWEEYAALYKEETLQQLDPAETFEELRLIATPTLDEMLSSPLVLENDDLILLCWCGAGKKCHRHIVSDWFKNSDFVIEEL